VLDGTGSYGTPLPAKLGVKAGQALLLDGAPPTLGLDGHTRMRLPTYDVILLFAPDRARLMRRWSPLAARLTMAGRLWVCWPKRASGLQTDLSESGVREHGLAAGLVDVKVCAVDEVWSGLAFVRRSIDRTD
jgi:hypothetical protein